MATSLFQSLRMQVAADTSLIFSPVSEADSMASITWLVLWAMTKSYHYIRLSTRFRLQLVLPVSKVRAQDEEGT